MSLVDVLRTERTVLQVRTGLLLLFGLTNALAAAEGAMPATSFWTMLGVVAVALASAAPLWWAVRKGRTSSFGWYALHTVDVALLTGVIVSVGLMQSPYAALLNAAHLGYFLLIVVAAMRFQVGPTVYAAVLSALMYVTVSTLISINIPIASAPAEVVDLVRPSALTIRAVFLVVTGGLSVSVIRKTQRAMKAMREADRKHLRFLNQISDGVLLFNQHIRIVDANAAACELLDMQRPNLLDLSAGSVLPSAISSVIRSRWKDISTQGSVSVYGVRLPVEDGAQRVLDLQAHRIRHPDEVLVQVVLRDVTAERKLEEQSALIERMRAVRALTSRVTHEFNNIFASIEASAFILQEAGGNEAPERTEVDTIREATARASGLIHELLDLTDVGPPPNEPLNVDTVVRKGIEAGKRDRANDVKVDISIPSTLRCVVGDEGQLVRAVGYLVTYAYEAMLDGGTLTVSARDVTISQSSGKRRKGDYVEITLRDSGIGMPVSVAAAAFDPVAPARDSVDTGAILGLPHAHAVVLRHGGTIELQSQVGQGTTFVLHLPATDRKSAKACVAPSVSRTPPEKSMRLLVVDDEPANRTSLARLLTFRGYDVLLAEDGASAIKIADEQGATIDLVLLDLVMPGMNGKDVLTALRSRHPDIKVLLVTGYAEQSLVREALEQGALGVAYKPFDVPELLEQVRELTCS